MSRKKADKKRGFSWKIGKSREKRLFEFSIVIPSAAPSTMLSAKDSVWRLACPPSLQLRRTSCEFLPALPNVLTGSKLLLYLLR